MNTMEEKRKRKKRSVTLDANLLDRTDNIASYLALSFSSFVQLALLHEIERWESKRDALKQITKIGLMQK